MASRHSISASALALLLVASGAARAAETAELLLPAASDALVEGALGLIGTYRPIYQGATEPVFKVKPAIFLRYGRWTLSSGGGAFGTRRKGDVARGLGVDVVEAGPIRVGLGLRYDGGRSEAESGTLAGLGDIPPTLRARVSASWRVGGPWRLGAHWSLDAFGRGGGNHGEVNLAWERNLSPATTLTLSGALGLAGGRYMQTYYGVSAEQAARTGYPEYEAGKGLRDISVGANLRHRWNREWTLVGGVGLSQLLGPAADSPLTVRPAGWGLSAGAGWHF